MGYVDRAAPLAIGTVLGRAFGVMSGNPVTVFGIAFLFGAVPQQVMAYLLAIETDGDDAAQAGLGALFIVYLLVFSLSSALAQAALVRATGAFIERRAATLGECLRVGLVKALPVIGLTILFSLGVAIGWVLLIVPGIVVGLMWCVTIPVLVEEDSGVIGAFARSRALTRGARWNIFFLFVIALLISWLVSAVSAVPGVMLGGDIMNPKQTPVTIVMTLLATTVTTALWATVVTSLYFQLRDWQEGPRTDQLADVFA